MANSARDTVSLNSLQLAVSVVGGILLVLTVIYTRSTALAARRTVETMEDTAKRELRAYMGTRPDGTHFEIGVNPGNGRPEERGGVKYFEQNYGQTPAFKIAMHVKVIKGLQPPPTFGTDKPETDIPKIAVMQTIYPGQTIGKIIDADFNRGLKFFLYGYIDYEDVFESKWRRRFAFTHDPERAKMGRDDRWIAHDQHNDEIPQPSEDRGGERTGFRVLQERFFFGRRDQSSSV